jgi:hypothetical protein
MVYIGSSCREWWLSCRQQERGHKKTPAGEAPTGVNIYYDIFLSPHGTPPSTFRTTTTTLNTSAMLRIRLPMIDESECIVAMKKINFYSDTCSNVE